MGARAKCLGYATSGTTRAKIAKRTRRAQARHTGLAPGSARGAAFTGNLMRPRRRPLQKMNVFKDPTHMLAIGFESGKPPTPLSRRATISQVDFCVDAARHPSPRLRGERESTRASRNELRPASSAHYARTVPAIARSTAAVCAGSTPFQVRRRRRRWAARRACR